MSFHPSHADKIIEKTPKEYIETAMELHQIPTRHQIFSKVSKPIAKHDDYRYFHRKFLSLPVIAKAKRTMLPSVAGPASNESPMVLVVQKPQPENALSLVKSHTSPEIKALALDSPTTTDEEEHVEERRHQFEEVKALMHVYHDDDDVPIETSREKPFNDKDSIQSVASPAIIQHTQNQFRYADMRSNSLDSDVIIGVFEGNIDSSDGELKQTVDTSKKPTVDMSHVESAVAAAETPMMEPQITAATTTPPLIPTAVDEPTHAEIMVVNQEVDNRYTSRITLIIDMNRYLVAGSERKNKCLAKCEPLPNISLHYSLHPFSSKQPLRRESDDQYDNTLEWKCGFVGGETLRQPFQHVRTQNQHQHDSTLRARH